MMPACRRPPQVNDMLQRHFRSSFRQMLFKGRHLACYFRQIYEDNQQHTHAQKCIKFSVCFLYVLFKHGRLPRNQVPHLIKFPGELICVCQTTIGRPAVLECVDGTDRITHLGAPKTVAQLWRTRAHTRIPRPRTRAHCMQNTQTRAHSLQQVLLAPCTSSDGIVNVRLRAARIDQMANAFRNKFRKCAAAAGFWVQFTHRTADRFAVATHNYGEESERPSVSLGRWTSSSRIHSTQFPSQDWWWGGTISSGPDSAFNVLSA